MIPFILIRMSVQNVDHHLEKLKACCRVCGKKLGKGARKTNVKYLQNDIFVLWGQNVALDSPHVHASLCAIVVGQSAQILDTRVESCK